MNTPTKDQILQALRMVRIDGRGDDIVTRGMVGGIQVRDGHVMVALEVDPRQGAVLEPLRQEAEKAVAALPGVDRVTAVLTAEKTAGKKPGPQPLARLPDVRYIIAVASGKGGVGKSTLAVNLAAALAQAGYRTGLMDADIYGPSVPLMLGMEGQRPEMSGDKLKPLEAHGLKVMSIGFLVESATPMIWRGPMIQAALRQFFEDVDWGALDFMIVDLPPGTGDAQLTMAQKVPLAGAVIVSTPQDVALLDAVKAMEMFRQVNVPVLGLIENMAVYQCPECGHEAHIFGHGGAREEAQRRGVPFFGEIPLHCDIRLLSDKGAPVVLQEISVAQCYKGIAQKVADAVQDAQASPMPSMYM